MTVDRRALLHAATPGLWHVERESLDPSRPERGPERWEIVAGASKRHRNRGVFHPEDAVYSTWEHHVVEFGYDRDYHFAEGGIKSEADAALIVQMRADYEALLDIADATRVLAPYIDSDDNPILGEAHLRLVRALAQLDEGEA